MPKYTFMSGTTLYEFDGMEDLMSYKQQLNGLKAFWSTFNEGGPHPEATRITKGREWIGMAKRFVSQWGVDKVPNYIKLHVQDVEMFLFSRGVILTERLFGPSPAFYPGEPS